MVWTLETTATGARVVIEAARDDDDPGVVVGRHKDCALRAGEGDATVSRRHAAFRVSRDGGLWCRDLGSTHGTRARAVEIGAAWTEVRGDDGEGTSATVTLGRGPTTVTCARREEDGGSETEPEDDGSETEPDDDGARTMVTEDGEMTRRRRRNAYAETLGEASTKTLETPAVRRETRVDKSARGSGRVNFKRFVKQRVVGLNEGGGKTKGGKSPKKKSAAVATNRRDVVHIEMNEDAKEELKRVAALDEEAETLWDAKVSAAGARKAPAKRKR